MTELVGSAGWRRLQQESMPRYDARMHGVKPPSILIMAGDVAGALQLDTKATARVLPESAVPHSQVGDEIQIVSALHTARPASLST